MQYGVEEVDLWDLGRQRLERRLRLTPRSSPTLKDILVSLGFSPDGRTLITAALEQVQLRELPGGAVRARLAGGREAVPLAGGRLLTLEPLPPWTGRPSPRGLRVWEQSTGRSLYTLPTDLCPSLEGSLPVAVSPDQRLLAFPPQGFGQEIEIWDVQERRRVARWKREKPVGFITLSFSPDGEQLAMGLGQGQPLTLWSWRSSAPVRTLAEAGQPERLYWSTAGLLLGQEGRFRLLDPRSGTLLQTLRVDDAGSAPPGSMVLPLGASAMSADRTTLAAQTRQGVRVWRAQG
ncbi:MAG: WD40 repeat domain-containing protein [Prochlorococcaceae cyanobacterium]